MPVGLEQKHALFGGGKEDGLELGDYWYVEHGMNCYTSKLLM